MNHKDYKILCEQLMPTVETVGAFIQGEVNRVNIDDIETKDRNSLVSYVDKEAEKMLVRDLRRILPTSGFITEENTVERSDSSQTWIIDPLDGTNNFLHRIPHFAISIALQVDGDIVIGIVYDVCKQDCYWAIKDGGAFINDVRINTSKTSLVESAMIATGFPYSIRDEYPIVNTLRYFMKEARGIRRYGAAALDLAYVACGRFDCYYETTLNSWDIAAGSLIVSEAGGRVTEFDGSHRFLESGQIVASNDHIHEELLQVFHQQFFNSN